RRKHPTMRRIRSQTHHGSGGLSLGGTAAIASATCPPAFPRTVGAAHAPPSSRPKKRSGHPLRKRQPFRRLSERLFELHDTVNLSELFIRNLCFRSVDLHSVRQLLVQILCLVIVFISPLLRVEVDHVAV